MPGNFETPSPLTVGVFLLLRDLIEARLGVRYEEAKRNLLESKLSERLQALQLKSFLDYFYLLKYGPGAEEEWPRLTDALSVQETYFWRELDHIRALVDVLVPQHVAAGRGPLHIWSAACATGEEPLSIAIALKEAGWFDRADVTISASDASPAAIERAQAGFYRERSFRALPLSLRDAYFTAEPGGWRVAPALHQRIRYSRVNLLDPAVVAPLATAPVIFCRNVFIYFSQATIARIVGQFAAHMPRPGFLFVGTSESLLRVHPAFDLEEIHGAFLYAKR
jgi:chemotaxis protein methyltransferase CheR